MFRKRLLIKTLRNIINELEDENAKLKYVIKEKDTNNCILLENSIELRQKIRNLEDNLEFVTNNLSAQKRKQLGL